MQQPQRGSRRRRRRMRRPECYFDCMCDYHEGVTARVRSRAVARRRARAEILAGLDAD